MSNTWQKNTTFSEDFYAKLCNFLNYSIDVNGAHMPIDIFLPNQSDWWRGKSRWEISSAFTIDWSMFWFSTVPTQSILIRERKVSATNVLSFEEGSGMKKNSANHFLDQPDDQIQLNVFRFTIFRSSTVRCPMKLFQFRLFVLQMVTFFFKSMQLIRSFRFF